MSEEIMEFDLRTVLSVMWGKQLFPGRALTEMKGLVGHLTGDEDLWNACDLLKNLNKCSNVLKAQFPELQDIASDDYLIHGENYFVDEILPVLKPDYGDSFEVKTIKAWEASDPHNNMTARNLQGPALRLAK